MLIHFFPLCLQTIASSLNRITELQMAHRKARSYTGKKGFIDWGLGLHLGSTIAMNSHTEPKILPNIPSLRLQMFLSLP